jgi:hypothetical protein
MATVQNISFRIELSKLTHIPNPIFGLSHSNKYVGSLLLKYSQLCRGITIEAWHGDIGYLPGFLMLVILFLFFFLHPFSFFDGTVLSIAKVQFLYVLKVCDL